MVPMLADCDGRAAAQIWRVKAATEVLPLVPVTAAMVARLARIEFRRGQRQRAARIGDVTTNGDGRQSAGGACSPATATAPAAIAASMKRAPSVLLPASAKNRSPGLTARLSDGKAGDLDRLPPRGSIVASSLKQVAKSHVMLRSPAAAVEPSRVTPYWRCPRCRKNKAVGRRQVEARLDAQQRRDAGDHLGRRSAPRSSPR